ncbi:MAG: hypothetical protein P0Y53_17995 [Candidatus Pseudobacter hemicellulosilyticus]|uniref:Uncharacterized protein n=1 Tax=Candidatus Pseudobacter hemicellulosilyticus TaxID=3121375 RepID=A0AAJ5WRG4_9BACT|nr:MAG: hypothetical protein P0Y53_17995 [Pseudobacter sp.]
MMPYIQNDQDYLAEKFHLQDIHIVHASKIALLKIQSWKFAMRTPEVGNSYLMAAEDMVRDSLLTAVPYSFILSEEGYHLSEMEN